VRAAKSPPAGIAAVTGRNGGLGLGIGEHIGQERKGQRCTGMENMGLLRWGASELKFLFCFVLESCSVATQLEEELKLGQEKSGHKVTDSRGLYCVSVAGSRSVHEGMQSNCPFLPNVRQQRQMRRLHAVGRPGSFQYPHNRYAFITEESSSFLRPE
jgi:hypothetical protein